MEKINLGALSEVQKDELYLQLENDKKARLEAVKRERDNYQQLKGSQVEATFEELQNISGLLSEAKRKIFGDFAALLQMKKDLFGMTDEEMAAQQGHSFTTADGTLTVIIGHNVIDSWDETVNVGQAKVNAWLEKQLDSTNATLISIIRDLLKPNKDGVLKASRVLDLSRKAYELGDKELIEAVDIIRDAYRPAKTTDFVKAKFKNEKGEQVWLPLSMSAS